MNFVIFRPLPEGGLLSFVPVLVLLVLQHIFQYHFIGETVSADDSSLLIYGLVITGSLRAGQVLHHTESS